MTLKDIKAEIREEMEKAIWMHFSPKHSGATNDVLAELNTALDRIAEATKEAIVPEKQDTWRKQGGDDFEDTLNGEDVAQRIGHNSCRAEALENYKQFTKEV